MVARIALALVALVVAGWLAVGLHDSRLLEGAERDAKTLKPGAPVAAIDDRLHAAELANPDRTPRFQRAALRLRAGRLQAGIRMLEDYLRSEPENREAWLVLADATRRSGDRKRSAAALRHFSALTSDEYRRALQQRR